MSDIELPSYNRTYLRESVMTTRNMPLIIKKIKKRVKIDLLREKYYIDKQRRNLTAWMYE